MTMSTDDNTFPVLDDEHRAAIRETGATAARRFRGLAGVDETQLSRVEAANQDDFERLNRRIAAHTATAGREVNERHDAELVYLKRSAQHHFLRRIDSIGIVKPDLCVCLPVLSATEADLSSTVDCDGCFSHAANLDEPANQAKPRVEVRSPGPGGTNSVDLAVRFDFEFDPGTGDDLKRCILPGIQISGNYTAMTWGYCGDGVEGSSARVRVDRRIEVYQDLPVFPSSTSGPSLVAANFPIHVQHDSVLDVTQAGGASTVQGFAAGAPSAIGLELNGNPVRVRMICRLRAEVTNYGWAIIDLSSSPHFYVRVPELRWGPQAC